MALLDPSDRRTNRERRTGHERRSNWHLATARLHGCHPRSPLFNEVLARLAAMDMLCAPGDDCCHQCEQLYQELWAAARLSVA